MYRIDASLCVTELDNLEWLLSHSRRVESVLLTLTSALCVTELTSLNDYYEWTYYRNKNLLHSVESFVPWQVRCMWLRLILLNDYTEWTQSLNTNCIVLLHSAESIIPWQVRCVWLSRYPSGHKHSKLPRTLTHWAMPTHGRVATHSFTSAIKYTIHSVDRLISHTKLLMVELTWVKWNPDLESLIQSLKGNVVSVEMFISQITFRWIVLSTHLSTLFHNIHILFQNK